MAQVSWESRVLPSIYDTMYILEYCTVNKYVCTYTVGIYLPKYSTYSTIYSHRKTYNAPRTLSIQGWYLQYILSASGESRIGTYIYIIILICRVYSTSTGHSAIDAFRCLSHSSAYVKYVCTYTLHTTYALSLPGGELPMLSTVLYLHAHSTHSQLFPYRTYISHLFPISPDVRQYCTNLSKPPPPPLTVFDTHIMHHTNSK